MLPHVVIIGGGFGGLKAARALRKAPVRITLLDRENHHLFQPLLYQVATAGLSPADIAAPIRSILRRQKNTEVFMGEVTGIRLKEKKVLVGELAFDFDYLIVATGSSTSYFGHKDWEKNAPGLKTVLDATRIRRQILLAFEKAEVEVDPEKRKALLTFALVGAGPTGVEMAGSIAELAHQALKSDLRHIDPTHTRIVLIEAGPRILNSFPESLAKKAETKLREMGVEIRVKSPVVSLEEDGVVFSDSTLKTKTVIWSAGVAASPAGKWLGAEVDRTGRVKVREDLSLLGHPDVFVIGDTSCCIQDGKPLPGVAPVAIQQGNYVAHLISRKVRNLSPPPSFRYIDKGNLATVGRSFAIADVGRFKLSGLAAWFAWVVVHIYYLIGFRNRVLVLVEWMFAYMTFQRGSRLITLENHKP